MNLFTRYLTRRNNKNASLQQFVDHWDALELLIITVFKSKQATNEDRQTYARLRTALTDSYPHFADALQPLWKPALVGGVPAPEDPFRRLFVHDSAEKFIGDWVAMQNLAAAREALNWLVLQQTASNP